MQRFKTSEETATSAEWEPRGDTVMSVSFMGTTGTPIVHVEAYDTEKEGWRTLRQIARHTNEGFMLFPAASRMRLRVQGNTSRDRISVKTYD